MGATKMTKEDPPGFGVGFLVAVVMMMALVVFTGFLANVRGRQDGMKAMQIKAVEFGVGTWDTDARGNTAFRWIPSEIEEPEEPSDE